MISIYLVQHFGDHKLHPLSLVSKKLGTEEYMETFGDLVEEIVARVFFNKISIPIDRERYKETFRMN
jgi:hypothetical protein